LARLVGDGPAIGARTVEGTPRQFLLVEIVREAHPSPDAATAAVSACRWHVNDGGALYGDHWGWCEDFQILPRSSPGYLVATTLFAAPMSGGYSTLTVLPPLPATVTAFGKALRLADEGGRLFVEREGERTALLPRVRVSLGSGRGPVEPPADTGHFEPGFDAPVIADLVFSAVSYGRLDSRRIAGRSAQ
jgi:hypothetical protein